MLIIDVGDDGDIISWDQVAMTGFKLCSSFLLNSAWLYPGIFHVTKVLDY